VIRAGAAGLRLDELGGIAVIAHPVADEPQPGQSPLYRTPRCRALGLNDGFICLGVILDQGGIDEGDPPYRVADQQHDNRASFTMVITAPSGVPNAGVRNRWGHLRATITDVLTEEDTAQTPTQDGVTEAAFWIAHALHVWVVEAEGGERDHRETLNRLGDLTPPDQPEAAD